MSIYWSFFWCNCVLVVILVAWLSQGGITAEHWLQSPTPVFIYADRTGLDELHRFSALSVDEDVFSGGIISKVSFNQCLIECDLSVCHCTADSRKPSSPRTTALVSIPALFDLKGIKQSFESFSFQSAFLCITAHERSSAKTLELFTE